MTLAVWHFLRKKIPMLLYCRPRIINLTSRECKILIPLNRRTHNHLGSMYFAALAAGADAAAGLLAWPYLQKDSALQLVFKDFEASFLKRAEQDTLFVCRDGQKVAELCEKAKDTGERQEARLLVQAYNPSRFGSEPVARFYLTMAVKYQQNGEKIYAGTS